MGDPPAPVESLRVQGTRGPAALPCELECSDSGHATRLVNSLSVVSCTRSACVIGSIRRPFRGCGDGPTSFSGQPRLLSLLMGVSGMVALSTPRARRRATRSIGVARSPETSNAMRKQISCSPHLAGCPSAHGNMKIQGVSRNELSVRSPAVAHRSSEPALIPELTRGVASLRWQPVVELEPSGLRLGGQAAPRNYPWGSPGGDPSGSACWPHRFSMRDPVRHNGPWGTECNMALVRSISTGTQSVKLHPTMVDLFYQILVDHEGRRYLHLSTFGSVDPQPEQSPARAR